VDLVRDGTEKQREFAALALANLAANSVENRVDIAAAGGVEVLVELASGGTATQMECAAWALGNLEVKNIRS